MRRWVSNTCLIRGWQLLPGDRLIGSTGGPDPTYAVYADVVRVTRATDDDREQWKRWRNVATIAHLSDKRQHPVGLHDEIRVALPRPKLPRKATR